MTVRALRGGAALLALLLCACAQPTHFSAVDKLPASRPDATTTAAPPAVLRVVLMPPDVELSEMTAGGVLEPQAAWTDTAKRLLAAALAADEALHGKVLEPYTVPGSDDARTAVFAEIVHLHRAVGLAIMLHKLVVPLPAKKERFDWSLGPDVAALHDYTGADYALFVYVRDSYSSGGRILVQLAAAALGVGVAGGTQTGYATLVDLRSGDVVWFNFLNNPAGDLRDVAGATATVRNLLAGMPR